LVWSLCYLVLRRLLQLAALRFRSEEFKELERLSRKPVVGVTRLGGDRLLVSFPAQSAGGGRGIGCGRPGFAYGCDWQRQSLSRLWVAQINRHSLRQAGRPRHWKRSALRVTFVCPKTGSASSRRLA
jgi:hypothetical protein